MSYNNKHLKGWIRVVVLLIFSVFFGNIFKLIGILIAGVDTQIPIHESSVYQLLIITFFDFIGTIAIIFILLKILDNESILNIGLKLKHRVSDILIGIITGFTIMGLATLFLVAIDNINFKAINFEFNNLVYAFLLFVFVAIKEEIVYRGYILRNLMYSFNKYIALIASAILFSLMHAMNPDVQYIQLLNLFLAGLLLGISYIHNKNLWFPISLHFSWNFFMSLLGLNASENDPYSLIKFDDTGTNLINIGTYSFDKSYIYTILNVILIICVFIWYRYKSEKMNSQVSS